MTCVMVGFRRRRMALSQALMSARHTASRSAASAASLVQGMLVEVVNSSTHRLSTATCSHFHLAHVKSGQIRDTRPKTGQIGVPGDLLIFFRDLRLKIGTVPENPGRMVTLSLVFHSDKFELARTLSRQRICNQHVAPIKRRRKTRWGDI